MVSIRSIYLEYHLLKLLYHHHLRRHTFQQSHKSHDGDETYSDNIKWRNRNSFLISSIGPRNFEHVQLDFWQHTLLRKIVQSDREHQSTFSEEHRNKLFYKQHFDEVMHNRAIFVWLKWGVSSRWSVILTFPELFQDFILDSFVFIIKRYPHSR